MPEETPIPEGEALLDGRYRLYQIVGEGGMAVVWRAEDSVLERTVAIKILRPQYAADPEFVDRFRSEARAAAALNHPGIVGVYDVGESDRGPYLVMEYVPGRDLKELLREEAPLAPVRAVEIGSAIAHAVARAHETGLVHRDIKPQNVLISPDGRMKVADFGIARAASAVGTTAPGIVLGTVHYLAPEQASGGPASSASDVYSLGVVLYEMLTNAVPHEADSSVGVAMKIVNEDPAPVDQLNPRVPAVLAGIVAKAMARRPEDRYEDAGALAEALDGFARWSQQATGAFRAAPKNLETLPTGGPTAPSSGTRAAAAGGGSVPLLDGTGLALATLALLSVAGLIPLWATVVQRVDPERVRTAISGAPPALATATPPPATPTSPPVAAVDVAVPDVRRLEKDEAIRTLEDRGLGYTWEVQEAITVPAGVVIKQEPAPGGDPVAAGTVVGLVVSGEPLATVPNGLEGAGYEQAAEALIALGLEPIRRDQWGGSETAAGGVLSIDPREGTRLPRGGPVYVTVNSGAWLPMGVDFDDHVHLSGIQLPRAALAPGDTLRIVAQWEATGDVEGDYRTVAELMGPDGPVTLDAHVPLGRNTNTWAGGETIFGDGFDLTVNPTTPPGEYQLVIGLQSNDDAAEPLGVVSAPGVRIRNAGPVAMTINVVAPASP